MKTATYFHDSYQYAYPLGPNKDSVSIVTKVWLDHETNEFGPLHIHVVLNYYSNDYKNIKTVGNMKEAYRIANEFIKAQGYNRWNLELPINRTWITWKPANKARA